MPLPGTEGPEATDPVGGAPSATDVEQQPESVSATPTPPPAGQPAGAPAGTARRPRADKRRGGLAFLRELPVLLLVAFILALLIKTFLVQAFYIPSASMEPTPQIGDRALGNKAVHHP